MTKNKRLNIVKWVEEVIAPTCPRCGDKLPSYPFYDEYYEYKHCEKCGCTHKKKRICNKNLRRIL